MATDEEEVKQLAKAIKSAQSIVFFGGAGVSTASGIPDFRSSNGIYQKETKQRVPAEEILSHHFFLAHPKAFFEFERDNLLFPAAKPNAMHLFLAALERLKKVTVVTQNIDDLHQKAGSKNVVELHGSLYRMYCTECGTTYDRSELSYDADGIPRCPKCGGIVRADVVLYEEMLDPDTIKRAISAISTADLLIVGGTSLVVYPANSFINYFRGKTLAIINKSRVAEEQRAQIVIHQPIEEVAKELGKQLNMEF